MERVYLKKFKKSMLKLVFVFFVFTSFTIIQPLGTPIVAETTYKHLLQKARSKVKYWGITGPIGLDPGPGGGGSGDIPDFVLNRFLSIDTDYENSWDITQILKNRFSQNSYDLYSSFGLSKNDFFNDLVDANTNVKSKLCIGFVGEGTMITSGTRLTPALVMSNGETITRLDLEEYQNSVSSWRTHAVFLYSCYSVAESDLADELNLMGADVVIGYKEEVEVNLALELTKIYWECLTTNETSIEGAYHQTYEAFEHAQSWAVFIKEHILDNEITLAIISAFAAGGMAYAVKLLISLIIESVLLFLLVFVLVLLLVLAVVIVIYTIIWAIVHLDWPMRMFDYNGDIETYL